MKGWRRFGLVLLAALAGSGVLDVGEPFGAAQVAYAQGAPPELTLQVSSDVVEVGEPFSLELKALVDDGGSVPTDPAFAAPPGVATQGPPRLSSQSFTSIGRGRRVVKTGIGATWILTASRAGALTLPSPTVTWNGKRLGTKAIQVTVVPAGSRPQRPRGNGGFLLPGGPAFPWPFGNSPLAETWPGDEPPPAAKELELATAPFEDVFLRAVIDKRDVVIGEQVTVSFYRYERDLYDVTLVHTAPLADFLRVPLLKDVEAEPTVVATVGGQGFRVKLLDRLALFPVRTGELHTGSLVQRLVRRGRGGELERRSDDLTVRVGAPPKEGRPAGYRLGDVGQFTLSAEVAPRRIEQGGSVSVNVKVTGTGNLPETLAVPARMSVDWLAPEKKERLEGGGGKINGYRTFGYVVRVLETGTVDLGVLELPYWDPDTKRYQVARATLGNVYVAPSTAPVPALAASSAAADAPGESDPLATLASLASPRVTLAPFAPPSPSLVSGSLLWLFLFAPPALVGLSAFAARARRRLAERRRSDAESAGARAEAALAEASKAADGAAVAACLERALHLAIEDATSLRSRGILLSELPAELTRAGVGEALAKDLAALLARCDAARFAPQQDASANASFVAEVRAALRDLGGGS